LICPSLVALMLCCVSPSARADVAPRSLEDPCFVAKLCPEKGDEFPVRGTEEQLDATLADAGLDVVRRCVRVDPPYTSNSGKSIPERKIAVYCPKEDTGRRRTMCEAAPSAGSSLEGAWMVIVLGIFVARSRWNRSRPAWVSRRR
jgi:hypothetical protein